jgi:hypothetical protein
MAGLGGPKSNREGVNPAEAPAKQVEPVPTAHGLSDEPISLGLRSSATSPAAIKNYGALEAQQPAVNLAAEFAPVPDLPMEKETVENLKAGDLVDLESCPFLKDEPTAFSEYAEVSFVERETEDCVLVGYEGIDHVGYALGTELLVCKLENRGLPEEVVKDYLETAKESKHGAW